MATLVQRVDNNQFIQTFKTVNIDTATDVFYDWDELQQDELEGWYTPWTWGEDRVAFNVPAIIEAATEGLKKLTSKQKVFLFEGPATFSLMGLNKEYFVPHGLKYSDAKKGFISAPVPKPKLTGPHLLKLKRSIVHNINNLMKVKYQNDFNFEIASDDSLVGAVRVIKACGYTNLNDIRFKTTIDYHYFTEEGVLRDHHSQSVGTATFTQWLVQSTPDEKVRKDALKEIKAWWSAIKK